jgi:multidrug efflux pump subunit AcrA (membrane-fusion protein)
MHTEVDIPNKSGVLIPGMYAEATLALDRKGDALVVPLQAVTTQGDAGASVFVVNAANRVEHRAVKLGVETDTDAEVLSGLKDGDEVVIGDTSGLRPGSPVHPKLTDATVYANQS